jgi:lipoprotein-releasing system permease protein
VQESILDYDAKAAQIKTVPGVTSVTPVVEGQVLVTSAANSAGAIVRGTKHEDIMATKWISDKIVDGSLAPYITGEGILIGARMAERFRVQAGEEITLISPKGNVSAFGSVPRAHAFKVAAIFNVGMTEYDGGVIFMPLALAQTYFKYPESVTNMEVRITDPLAARATARAVEDVLGPTKVRVFTWEQTNGPFFNALQVERNVMFLILTLIILVAAMNIISGLIMLVKDKGRDIAILRTMGATRGMIMRIFLLGGASVGVIGTLIGFVLGLLFCDNIESIRQFLQRVTGTELFSPEIYYLTQIPAKMDWNETVSVVIMALVLSFVATLYPSWRAAKTDPVEALRYE